MTPIDDFEAAAAKVAGQSSGDPMDTAAASVVQGQRTSLRSSLYGALLENPDMAARAQKLGRKTGIPADVVGRNLPEVERNAKLDEFDRVLDRSPTVAQWLTEQNNAKIAHDDVDNLGALDATLTTLSKAAKYLVSAPDAKNTLMGDLGAGAARASRGAAGMFQAAAEVPAPLLDWMEPMTSVGGNPLRRLAEGFAMQGQAAEQTAKSLSPQQDGLVASGISSGVQSLAQNLLTLPLAFFPGGQGAALTSMAGMTGGQSYQDAREKGIPMEQALPFAASQAVIEYATEKIPVSRLIGDLTGNATLRQVITRQIASEVPGEQVATVLQDLNEWAVLNPDKPFSAYLAERPGAALQTLIATVVGVGGNIAVMTPLERASRNAEMRVQSAQSAEQRAQVVEQLNTLAEASKVRERDADTFEQFIAQATDGAPVQNVYIDANTLMQSGMGEQLAQVSPSVAAQLPTALASGGEIQIPVAEYTARIAGTEYAQGLMDDLRVEGEQFTRREAQEFMQNQAGELEAEFDRVLAEKQADDTFKASAETVKAEIKSQLDTVARFTPQVNEAYASMVGNFYAVMGAKIGATPEEVFAKYPLRVTAEAVQSGPVLGQGGQVSDWADREIAPVGSWVKADYKLADSQPVYQVRDLNPSDLYLPELDEKGRLQPEKRKYLDSYTERAKAGEVPPSITVIEMEDGRLRVVDGHRRALAAMAAGKNIRALVSPLVNTPDGRKEATVENIKQLNQSAQSLPPTIEIDGKQRPTTNSNGQPIAATEAGVRNFWKWFGDSKVVDASGKPLVVYHGTASTDITEFRPRGGRNGEWQDALSRFKAAQVSNARVGYMAFRDGSFFSPKADYAGHYTREGQGVMYPVYVKAENPVFFNQVKKGDVTGIDAKKTPDALIMHTDGDVNEVAVIDPTQIKSAIGNSGEFDPANPNILMQSDSERNLIVAHNLTADNLRNALDLGGLPAPSLAITKVDSPIQGFGEITLVGDTKLAKPSAKNPVFNADVYSPRFPDVKVKVDDRKVVGTLYPLHEAAKDVGLYAVSPDRVADEMARNQLVRSIGDVVNDLGMRYGYAVRVLGKDVKVPTKAVEAAPDLRPTKGSIVTQEPLASVLASIPEFGKTVTAGSEESAKIAQALYSAMLNRFIAEEAEKGNGDGVEAGVALANRRIKMFAEGEGESVEMASGVTATWPERMTLSGLSKLWNAWRAQGSTTEGAPQPAQPRQEVDIEALTKTLDEVVDKDQMRQWVRDQLASTVGEKRIVKEDGKTAAYSLQNIVKAMTGKVRDAEGFNYGLGNARSKGAKSFKSIADIQANRDQVKAKAEADSAIKEAEKKFSELSDELDQYLSFKGSMYSPSSFEALADAIGLSYSQGVDSALSMAGFRDVPPAVVKKVQQFASELTSLPTEYFEAKPQRAVGVDEFRGAVIPDTTPADVRNALADMGLTLVEYRKGDEVSRAQAARTLSEQLDAETKDVLFQTKGGNRGAFNPSTNTITLLKGADLSTFLHESGHFFLEVQFDIASRLQGQRNEGASLSEGEQRTLDDTDALLKWFGIESLNEWYGLDFEEKRTHHEKFARGFEAYLFEGKAPSIELQGLFQRFRAWLLNVYRDLKALNVELTDEVRGVMDRMLATSEQIKLAEQGRSMMPLFTSPEQAGMTPQEFAAYQALGTQATNDAIEDVQARTLRDMQWLRNSRGREVKRLQKLSAELRRDVTIDVRREVLSQPVYRAWQFLTRKITPDDKLDAPQSRKSDPNTVEPDVDSLFTAIAKLGGLNKGEVVGQWGSDPKDKPASGVFGKPVWRREGGLSIDAMAEALGELGYLPLDENGKVDTRDLEERFDSELRGAPVYSDRYDYSGMREGRAGDGVNVEALTAGRFDLVELRAMGLPTEMVDRIQNLKMTGKVGLHPDIVAEMFGFTSGDELVRNLAAADKPSDAIEGLVDARMLELHGELATPEAIERAADQAIHNDARARFVATEANALAKATGQRKILASAARDFAAATIARLKVRNIRPGQYVAGEMRAAKAAQKASESGDLTKAAAEKRNQLVQNYLTKSAYEAQDEVDRGVRYLKKFDSDGFRKTVDAEYADQIDALLDRFDLRKSTSLKAVDKRKSLLAWAESQREQGFEPDIPEDLLNEARRQSYKEMTVEEFRGLLDTVKQIEHLGRLKDRLLTAADNRAFAAVKDEIVTSITDNAGDRVADTRTPTTNLGRALQSIKNFGAEHVKAATWARILDGGKDGGAMWEYLIRSANERGNMETTMRADATVKLSEILAPVFKLGRMGGAGQFFPTINRSLNREARLAIALNVGNQSNLQRLLGGEGWTLEQIRPVLQSLSAAEWQAVQAVWDHFESYRPQIAAKERRVYGKEPTWLDPTAFTVTAADGAQVEMRGGYYPIKYDPAASQRAEEHADAEGAKRQLQGAYTSATTRRSFTKARAEEVNGRPLLYTLAGLYGGVNDVIHDLTWHEWLIDANRIMRSKSVDAAIRNHYGPAVKAQFKSWINDIAEGDRGAQNAAEVALGRLRQGVSAAGLGFNVTSAAMQITGFNQSIVRVGAKWIAKGVAQYIASPIGKAREVVGKSEFMADRSRTQFRELNEIRNRVQDENATMRTIKMGTYFLMMRMQKMVDVPTWLGAYEKAIVEGNGEDRAIALADQAVIDSQGSGMTKDLSAIERGGPVLKVFTVYYSFMNTALNIGVTQSMTAKSKAKLAADLLMLYTVPAVLGSMLKDALTPDGGGDDDEDLEAIARKLAAEQLSYLMGLFVVAREFGEVSKIVTGAEGPRRDYSGPAGLRPIADTFTFAKQAGQGEFDAAFRKASINLLGDFTGLPSAQINRTITGIEALEEGQTDNPAAVLFGYKK